MKWEDDGAWLGVFTMLNTGECPNAAVVSRLSQILEATPHPKYSLTAKACLGILRRAERRGKDLPKLLKQVLLMQSASGGGCDGGGKGALVQTEKSGTLGTGNDQTIFCMATQQGGAEMRTDDRAPTLMSGNNQPVVAIPINDKATRWQGGGESRNHDGSGNGLGIGKEGDPSPTLTAGDRHGVMCMTPWDAQSQRVYDGNGVSPTLSSRENSGLNREAVLCAGFKLGDSEQARSIGYQEELSPTLNAECGGNKPAVLRLNDQGGSMMGVSHDVSGTLRAQEHGHQPAVMAFDTTQITSKQNGSIPDFGKSCHTLNANAHVPCAVLDMSHACDVIRDCGEVAPSLQARMGTGGNQIPLTYQKTTGTLFPGAHAGSYNGQDAYNDMLVVSSEISPALRAKVNDPYRTDMTAYVASVDCRNFTEGGEINGTLQAKESGGQSLNLNNTIRQNMVVRRLTPLECERLQGFPEYMEMDVEKMTKDEYIAVNIATGQIVVDCENGEIYTTKGPGGVRLKEPKKLDGSNVNGYKVVSIRNGQTKMQCRVHRIVWIARNGVIPEGYVVDHINNDKTDNRICNLQILTAEENSHKAWRDGRYLMGDDNPSTKLPVSKRKEIVELYKSGEYTMRQLANDFGISKSRIHQIVKTSGWTDIGDWTDSKGKKHKAADSPRYKALGNSIALPFWQWMFGRMAKYLPENATLGSLFDGIGGFPLTWQRIHGEGSARWSSEIEEFPMAVTRLHFGTE
jgi:Sigma-70, region 4./HNH endonuclease.